MAKTNNQTKPDRTASALSGRPEIGRLKNLPPVPQLCKYLSEKSPQPMVAVDGTLHVVSYANPAFARLVGKGVGELIGRPFAEAVPEGTQNGCLALLDRVFRTGTSEKLLEQEHLQSKDKPVYWSYMMWAILGPDETPIGVMIQITDATETAVYRHKTIEMNQALLVSSTTQHALAERADELSTGLQASISVRDYLLKLSDILRQISSATEIQEAATRSLGEYLRVDRVGFAEIESDALGMTVHSDWTKPGASSLVGQYRVDDFNKFFTTPLQEGKTAVVHDAKNDLWISLETFYQTWSQIGCRSGVAYPLIKNGDLIAAIFVHSVVPRVWRDVELSLIAETAERAWAAQERLRAQAKLRQSKERQTFLLKLSDVLRSLSGRIVTQKVAMRLLGEQLDSTRAFYFLAQPTDCGNWKYVVEADYRRDLGAKSVVGTHSVNDFGSSLFDAAEHGKTVAISDINAVAELTEAEVQRYLAIDVLAFVIVPIVQNGKFVAGVGAHHAAPHVWTSDEIELIREVAVRTWSAVERARAISELAEMNRTLESQVAERTQVAENRALALRSLAAELSSAEHRERKRLAHLLHDDLQQILVGARYMLPDLAPPDSTELAERLNKLDDRLKECLNISRDLSRELSPPILEQGSLEYSLRWLANHFDNLSSFVVDLEFTDGMPDLPEHLHLFLFYATRELVCNALKYSGCRSVTVEVSHEDSVLTLQVDDEGESFNPEKTQSGLQQPETFGLFQIRERLEALGGKLVLSNSVTGGASIRLVVPFQ